MRDCFWCDDPIEDYHETEILPEDRGIAHAKCAEEWYGVQMAYDD